MTLASSSLSTVSHAELAHPSVLIVLSSFCAEGTPILTLELCRYWQSWGIYPIVVTLYDHPRDLQPEFEALSIPLHCLNLPKQGYWRYAQMGAAIYGLARRYRTSAFLSMPFGWHTIMAVGAKLAGVKRVAAHVGNYPPYEAGTAFDKFRRLVQWGRSLCDGLICCSDYIRDGVIQHFGVNESETLTIYNGCAIEAADVLDDALMRSLDAPFTIGMVARLEQHKDQPTLIRAAHYLKQQNLDFTVQLIGDGSRRQEYEQLAAELDVSDRIQFLGTRRDIPDLLSQMDLFVFAAKPDEGFGIALVEAMMAGVPIVATDVGACCEVLEDGDLGLLVPRGDAEKLAIAIQYAARHPDQMQWLATRAQQSAQENFSMETMAYNYATYLRLIP